MAADVKTTLLRALSQHRGDDLERARMAFRGLSAEEMGKQYGQPGQTRREILAEYEEHAADVERAGAFVRGLQ